MSSPSWPWRPAELSAMVVNESWNIHRYAISNPFRTPIIFACLSTNTQRPCAPHYCNALVIPTGLLLVFYQPFRTSFVRNDGWVLAVFWCMGLFSEHWISHANLASNDFLSKFSRKAKRKFFIHKTRFLFLAVSPYSPNGRWNGKTILFPLT